MKKGQVTECLIFGEQAKWFVNKIMDEEKENNTKVQITGIKRVFYGGMKLPKTVLLKLADIFPNSDLYGIWGMTELGGVGTILPPSDHKSITSLKDKRLESCGIPIHPSKLRIVGMDGKDKPIGEEGEIWIHKDCVTEGYLNSPQNTKDLFEGEWMKTGDVGKLDEDGYLYILDRIKDVIKVPSGRNVYSIEVEGVVSHIPGVKEVAAVGIPGDFGEAIKVCVIRSDTDEGQVLSEDIIRNFCKKNLAEHKVPNIIQFLDDFPRSSNFKVKKHLLRHDPTHPTQ